MKHHFFGSALLTGKLGQQLMDSLAGVAHCRNNIDSAQWLAQAGQESAVECKGKSQPDWLANKMQSRQEIEA